MKNEKNGLTFKSQAPTHMSFQFISSRALTFTNKTATRRGIYLFIYFSEFKKRIFACTHNENLGILGDVGAH